MLHTVDHVFSMTLEAECCTVPGAVGRWPATVVRRTREGLPACRVTGLVCFTTREAWATQRITPCLTARMFSTG